MEQPCIFFITGASASGKTTLLEMLMQQKSLSGASFHSFDSIGIPSPGVMQRDFGGPERWQEMATHTWIDRVLTAPEPLAVIEGSTRPQFVLAAFRRAKVRRGTILLLDCDKDERLRRLQMDRAQPELANFHMFAWAAYLRGQADALGIPVLNTSGADRESTCHALAEQITQFAAVRRTQRNSPPRTARSGESLPSRSVTRR